MAGGKDVICPSCHKRVEGTTRVDKPVQRVAVRCRHTLGLHCPDFTAVWCPECALAHNECALCGEKLP